MGTKSTEAVKMMHMNKRRLQSYTEFIKGYKQYKHRKKALQN